QYPQQTDPVWAFSETDYETDGAPESSAGYVESGLSGTSSTTAGRF
ncbi:hypothetical protein A2U01_0113955, partial [Trifolium medium]|nr:hypothetical protein [Trifolium medium]